MSEKTDPSVNDVLAQQMGTAYGDVENADKQALQKDLNGQGANSEDIETGVPSAGAVDDRNTSNGQMIGY